MYLMYHQFTMSPSISNTRENDSSFVVEPRHDMHHIPQHPSYLVMVVAGQDLIGRQLSRALQNGCRISFMLENVYILESHMGNV